MPTKSERLKSRKDITELFESGRSLSVFPLRILWIRGEHSNGGTLKAAFTVPSRRFRLAVDRNRLKRQMRETYRLNQALLLEPMPEGIQLNVIFIYIGKRKEPYHAIDQAMQKLLTKLADTL